MSILISCPKCGKKLRARDELIGQLCRCSNCQSKFAVRQHQAEENLPSVRKASPVTRPGKETAPTEDDDATETPLSEDWKHFWSDYLSLPWHFGGPHLRRCITCGGNQYTHFRRCIDAAQTVNDAPELSEPIFPHLKRCNGLTVSTDLIAVFSGADLDALIALEQFYVAKKRMLNSGIVIWSLAAIGMLIVCFANVRYRPLLLFMLALAALVCHVSALALARWWFTRRHAGPHPRIELISSQFSEQLQHLAEKIVNPFLHRNQIAEGGRVKIASSEEKLLIELLAKANVQLHPQMTRAFLTACALRRDYGIFCERLSSCTRADQISLVAGYTNLFPDEPQDRTNLPMLRQMLSNVGAPIPQAQLLEEISKRRNKNRLRGFALDLAQRRQGEVVNVRLEDVDRMNPFNFELLVGMIYESLGYAVTETPKSGDQGADVFLEKAGEKTVVQTKLYTDSVGNHAVQEVIAAKQHFRCHHAVVLTTSMFTRSAKELAATTNVQLIDRQELQRMLEGFNKSPKDHSRLATLLKPTMGQTEETSQRPYVRE
jgi:HJR/Mrr/RecB family endonuclease